MAPHVDFAAFLSALTGLQILGIALGSIAGSIGVAVALDRIVHRGEFR